MTQEMSKVLGRLSNLRKLADWSANDVESDAKVVALTLPSGDDERMESAIYRFLAAVRQANARYRVTGKPDSVKLLVHKLAYATWRQERDGNFPLQGFFEAVKEGIARVNDQYDSERLVSFVEATVAYHKSRELLKRLDRVSREGGRS